MVMVQQKLTKLPLMRENLRHRLKHQKLFEDFRKPTLVVLNCLLVREKSAVCCQININFYLICKEITKSSTYKM